MAQLRSVCWSTPAAAASELLMLWRISMTYIRKGAFAALGVAALALTACATPGQVKRAQATADQALATAQSAQSTATMAAANAQKAQQTADAASATASQAQATAASAQTTAQSAADSAREASSREQELRAGERG